MTAMNLGQNYAHRRLGFTDNDIREWLSSAGLSLAKVETIETRDDRPDVRIWIGANPISTRKEA